MEGRQPTCKKLFFTSKKPCSPSSFLLPIPFLSQLTLIVRAAGFATTQTEMYTRVLLCLLTFPFLPSPNCSYLFRQSLQTIFDFFPLLSSSFFFFPPFYSTSLPSLLSFFLPSSETECTINFLFSKLQTPIISLTYLITSWHMITKGLWQAGNRHGKGRFTRKQSSEVYDGDWLDDVKHGRGTLTLRKF